MGLILEIIEQPTDPIGGASGEKRLFALKCLGKQNTPPSFPYTIANEVVASHLGQCLGLNLPTVMTHRTDGQSDYALVTWYERVPETAAKVEAYVAKNPREVHGAIMFDLFVANNDRAFGPERRNLGFDDDGRLFLYDQGNACFYRNRTEVKAGIPRLDAVEKDLVKMFDMDHKGNFYRQLLKDWKEVDYWWERLSGIPDFVIEAAVDRIPKYLTHPNQAERTRLIEFLVKRKKVLMDQIIKRQRTLFPQLPKHTGNA